MLGMGIVSLGKGRTMTPPHSQDGRRAPMTIDAHVLYICFHYVYRSPIDIRVLPCLELKMSLAAPMLISSKL